MVKHLLMSLAVFGCCGFLVAGCAPKADTPPLDAQASQAKGRPGADTPPAQPAGDAAAARKAKSGD